MSQIQSTLISELVKHPSLMVRQRHEIGEWFGFETRNKYEIIDPTGRPIGFAAEQQKGVFGFLMRQFLGHWRTFTIHFYDVNHNQVMTVDHPFRLLFKRLEVKDATGRQIGAIQQRFSILTKRFDVENERGAVIMEVASPIWKIWTFPFTRNGRQVASVQKKWTGLGWEAFTDKDNFLVEFTHSGLTQNERQLALAAALFIDLQYFEDKAD